MRSYNENSYHSTPTYDVCEVINGNNIDFEIKKTDCEIRADILVSRVNTVRIWGQVKDCEGNAVSNALVKLVKPVEKCGHVEYQGIAHAITDCNGFYQFDIAPCSGNTNFKILVGKSTSATDRIITNKENCNLKPVECCRQPERPCPKPEPPCHKPEPYCNQPEPYYGYKCSEKIAPCKTICGKGKEPRCEKQYPYYYSE